MRRTLFFILLLGTHFCSAQNYNCVQADTTRYYTNSTGYLRRITIDSVKTEGIDTVYYPFKTYRLHTLPDGTHGSWVSSRIVKKNNGTFLFHTAWNDTVFIKTQADSGESWTFYTDTSSRWYQATVVSVDTATFMGFTDSVKRIKIAPYVGSSIDTIDIVGHFEIILSKNHGFVQTFELYLFPFRNRDTSVIDMWIDPYLNEYAGDYPNLASVPRFLFSMVDYHIPTKHEIYDFNIGDVFVSSSSSESPGYNSYSLSYDSIVGKTIISPFSTLYDTYTKRKNTISPYGGPNIYSNSSGPGGILADTSTLGFNVPRKPEDYSTRLIASYFIKNDTSNCITSPYYKVKNIIIFEGCEESDEYKTGFKQLYHRKANFFSGDGGCYPSTAYLVFSKKNGVPCGSRPSWSVGIAEVEAKKEINIFPNPTNRTLTIEATSKINDVSIYNMMGQIVYRDNYNGVSIELDVSMLTAGVYFVKINNSDVRKFLKQ